MKHNLALATLAAMIAAVALLTSCSKEENNFTPTSNSSWRGNVKSIVDAQVAVASSTSTAEKKSGWGCAGADAAGALSGAAAGYELFPHWGAAVAGGIIGGAGASISYWYRTGQPTGNGPWDPQGPNPYDPRNPYYYAGILHNEICLAATQDPSMFDADGKINITRLNELGMDIINRRKEDFEALKGLDLHNPIPSMNLLPLYDSINSTIDNGDYVISYTNSDINWFCGEFQRGLSSCSTPDDIRIYVSKLDETILSSDLNEETKGSMLMTLSVLENSTHFWYE